jgi:tetratricopeptide (TPR) repeat protein
MIGRSVLALLLLTATARAQFFEQVDQSTEGSCSPVFAKIEGNATVNCNGLDPVIQGRMNELLDKENIELNDKVREAERWAGWYRKAEAWLEESGDTNALEREAEEALHGGEVDMAGNLLDQAIERGDRRSAKRYAARAAVFALKFDYTNAWDYYQKALDLQPDDANLLADAGLLASEWGHLAEAEPLLKRALTIRERTLGPQHPDLATSLNNLALLYMDNGHFAEAEPLLRRALTIRERTLGPEHPRLAFQLSNLAALYQNAGLPADAELLYERALAILEKTRGLEFPITATVLGNLATLYQATNRLEQAEPLLKQTLVIDETTLGPQHPDVAVDLNNLASIYSMQGRPEQAKPLLKRVLTILEKSLPPDHPNLATAYENYAIILDQLGRTEEATEFRARAEVIRQ